ncbi:hypothetical protein ZHAS_00009603 [Anopheles sinensis]|uniref:Uncharacterized protein n=1 Tax=Anopheles sinensis TaxID=74873 RepID=A0A084VVM9_ANOSI|nr:hypothetical protein ZHAS_00009603 [Anopheles sinensis]
MSGQETATRSQSDPSEFSGHSVNTVPLKFVRRRCNTSFGGRIAYHARGQSSDAKMGATAFAAPLPDRDDAQERVDRRRENGETIEGASDSEGRWRESASRRVEFSSREEDTDVTHVAHPASGSAGTGTSEEHVDDDGAGAGAEAGVGGRGELPTRPLITAGTASSTPPSYARSPLSPTWCLPSGRVTAARRHGDHWATRPCRTAIVALHLHHYTLLTPPSRSAAAVAGNASASKPATPPTLAFRGPSGSACL